MSRVTAVDERRRPEDALVDGHDDLGDLVDRYQRHLLVVTAHPAADGSHRRALAALTIASAILDALVVERWSLVRAALANGATVAEVGAALGDLEPDEVTAGLTSWADRQVHSGLLSEDDHDAVLALLARTTS